MKMIFIILLSTALAFVLHGCISKRIVQEINFKNLTGAPVKITYQRAEDSVTLVDGKSIVFDISSTDFIRIAFSDTNEFYKYDLSKLDMSVTVQCH